jgi:outer membrane lipoprotein-sorting protein
MKLQNLTKLMLAGLIFAGLCLSGCEKSNEDKAADAVNDAANAVSDAVSDATN